MSEVWYNGEMAKVSAGILMYRRRGDRVEVLLVHPGGPLWVKRDLGAWSIPKGLVGRGEEPLAAARREFREETGFDLQGRFLSLGEVRQKSGKVILAWAVEGDCDPGAVRSNTFSMEWPPHSGRDQEFPEVDRAAWFSFGEAGKKINQGQAGLLEELQALIGKDRRG